MTGGIGGVTEGATAAMTGLVTAVPVVVPTVPRFLFGKKQNILRKIWQDIGVSLDDFISRVNLLDLLSILVRRT